MNQYAMKKVLLTVLLAVPFALFSQTSGSITYEEKRQIKIDFGGNSGMNEELKSMIPDSKSVKKILHFNSEHSLYENVEKDAGDQSISQETEGMNLQIVVKVPENVTYQNYADNKTVEKREFMDRIFLISDEAEKRPWKITGEQKEILGYVCQKATTERDSSLVEAWFTPQIPVSGGPGAYGGLPGLILETNTDEGSTIVSAVEINLDNDVTDLIIPPTKGKKVSRKAFKKIQEEKFKEMKMQYGGSGSGKTFIIKGN